VVLPEPEPALEAEAVAEPEILTGNAMMNPSRWPALIRAYAMVFKWGTIGVFLLGAGYAVMRFWLLPVINELRNPGKTDAIHDKSAPTAVRALQQTKQVVAANDANVAYLNSIIDGDDKNAAKEKAAPKPPPPVAPVVAPAPVPVTGNVYRDAVARLKVSGVFEGAEPRVYLDGRIVKFGEIVDRALGLRFIRVDTAEHAIIFSNAENETFKKFY
jgi:hypothetical protein